MSAEVRNALTKALADGLYLRLDTSNDPMQADLDMGEFDILNADVIYGGTTVASGLTIAANTQATTIFPIGGITTEGWINLYPGIPDIPAFTGSYGILSNPTFNIGPVASYFLIRDTGTIALSTVFTSYGLVYALGTATEANVGNQGALYLFVSEMISSSSTAGAGPAAYRSFDHRPIIQGDGAAVGNCPQIAGLTDLGRLQAINNGSITLDDWTTVQFIGVGLLGAISATAGASATVTNKYGFHFGNCLLAGSGGTEILVNQYGGYVDALTTATTINCGLWIEGASGATANYGIILGSSDLFGGAIWFGAGQNAKIGYDGTDLVLFPDVVGSGIVLVGTTGNKDMRLNNIEIDGVLNHDGSTAGFFNVTPVVQQTAPAATTPSNLQAGDYGELYVEANATPTVIAVQNTWYQVTIFTAAGQSRGSTVSAANDDITIATTGIYQIMVSTSFTGGAGKTYEIEVQKNNGANRLINLHGERRVSAGGDMASMSISGLASLTSTDTIELWIRGLDVITANATIRDVNISLIEIGTFAGESATETDILALATETNAHRTNLINLGLQI